MTLYVNFINVLRKSLSAKVQHFFWGGNTLANYFGNLVFIFVGDYHFNSILEIPTEEIVIFNMNRIDAVHIRSKEAYQVSRCLLDNFNLMQMSFILRSSKELN